jgi:hypothetical protein
MTAGPDHAADTPPAAPSAATAAPAPVVARTHAAALRAALEVSTAAVERMADKVRRRPGTYIRWLPRQHRFLLDPSRRKLIRAGNQHSGKTTVALYEVICRCLGRHRSRLRRSTT